MTIDLQIGRTYRTRDGRAKHTIERITDTDIAVSNKGHSWWVANGQKNLKAQNHDDLVEDVTMPASPVRTDTVITTRTTIVPGNYGKVIVGAHATPGWIDIRWFLPGTTIDELDAAAATLTQLADALRAIAKETQA